MLAIRFCLVVCLNLSHINLLLPFTSRFDDLDHLTIEGRITDTTGAAVAGAQVIARQEATGSQRTAIADARGSYRLGTLSPGKYLINAEAVGFRASVAEGVAGLAGMTIRRDFRLPLNELTDQLTITAHTDALSTVDSTRTVVGATLDRREIDALPIDSRNPLDLLFTLPGVAAPALSTNELAEGDVTDHYRSTPEESGVFALHGGTPFSNNLTIEGFDNNDDRAARERVIPSPDAVEEVQVIANQFSAEYGRASGGRVNLQLRGGTNEYHGRGFHYFRDARLNANSFHRNADPQRGFRLPFTEHNPGASFGGPLRPDQIFFFVAGEHNRVSDHAEISALLPLETNGGFRLPKPNGSNLGHQGTDRNGRPLTVNGGTDVGLYDLRLSTPKNAQTWQSRVDLNLGEKHHAFTLATFARQRDKRGFPGGRRLSETVRPTGRDSWSLALSDTFVLSTRAISQSRVQISRLAPHDAPLDSAPVMLIEIDDPRDVTGDASANPFSRSGTLVAGASTTGGSERREARWQFQETLSFDIHNQTWRIGVDGQWIRSRYRDLEDATGTFTFATPADFITGRPARYQHRFATTAEQRNAYLGLFLQYDWRLLHNLTLALGLRWDNETVIADRDNFGPRAAMAWAPGGSKRLALRAGFGLFYNRALLRTLDDFALTSGALHIDTNLPATASLLPTLRFPEVLAPGDPRVIQYGIRETAFRRRLEPSFRLPESHQSSLGFEFEVRRGLKIEANYVFNRGAHLWREVNINAPRLPVGFASFSELLRARDFDNALDPLTGMRPITTTGNADIVRFNLSQTPSQTAQEGGKRIIVFGLAQPSTSNTTSARRAALAVIRSLRPDPSLEQVEELQARGNSFYHGLSLAVGGKIAADGFLRAGYTLSRLIDDGVVNTSSPLIPDDFQRERAASLLDARHRVNISWQTILPVRAGRLIIAGTYQLSSPRPFSIGIGGNDRNLDDVNNDRPNFHGRLEEIEWRRPGVRLDPVLLDAFSLPLIGESGNLPRNAGRGPWQQTLNLRLSRLVQINERVRITPQIEALNPLNATQFSFGAEFVDYTPNNLGDFLVPGRTVKPRTVRIGLRIEF
jgi:hypothetical protein